VEEEFHEVRAKEPGYIAPGPSVLSLLTQCYSARLPLFTTVRM
jgi:hypothetical protein